MSETSNRNKFREEFKSVWLEIEANLEKEKLIPLENNASDNLQLKPETQYLSIEEFMPDSALCNSYGCEEPSVKRHTENDEMSLTMSHLSGPIYEKPAHKH